MAKDKTLLLVIGGLVAAWMLMPKEVKEQLPGGGTFVSFPEIKMPEITMGMPGISMPDITMPSISLGEMGSGGVVSELIKTIKGLIENLAPAIPESAGEITKTIEDLLKKIKETAIQPGTSETVETPPFEAGDIWEWFREQPQIIQTILGTAAGGTVIYGAAKTVPVATQAAKTATTAGGTVLKATASTLSKWVRGLGKMPKGLGAFSLIPPQLLTGEKGGIFGIFPSSRELTAMMAPPPLGGIWVGGRPFAPEPIREYGQLMGLPESAIFTFGLEKGLEAELVRQEGALQGIPEAAIAIFGLESGLEKQPEKEPVRQEGALKGIPESAIFTFGLG